MSRAKDRKGEDSEGEKKQEEEEEFRIIETPDDPGIDLLRFLDPSTIPPTADPETAMRMYDIDGNDYSLDRLDADARDELSYYSDGCTDFAASEKIEMLCNRSVLNSSDEFCSPADASQLFRTDPPCGAIYACNAILHALCSLYGITETESRASYAYCILLARKKEFYTKREFKDLTKLFMYRDLCATHVVVKAPKKKDLERWEGLLIKTVSRMYTSKRGKSKAKKG